ncbi:hypothetical protein BH10BAC1_BH10BAC1_01330 [soil metagenome]
MRKLITFSLLVFSSSFIKAQTNEDDYFSNSKPKLFSKDKVSASVSAGAGVSFLGNSKTTAFTSFIAPKIGYQLTNKFKLNVGLMHYTMTGNTFMPLNQNEGLFNSSNKARTGNLIFVEGQYQLNKRVALIGAVMYDANNLMNKQSNYKAVSVGMDYKVSKNSSIQFQATISQGQNSYYNTHTGMYGFDNNAPMGQMFGGIGQDFSQRLNSIR